MVVVTVEGEAPALGNVTIGEQGTGFFISQNGYLVTSRHLQTKLIKRGVEASSLRYSIKFSAASSDAINAAPIYESPAADLSVLYAPVGDRNVKVLKPAIRSNANIDPGITPIFTAGFPGGYGFTVDQGVMKSFAGPIAPIPVWTTSLTFKEGQSGSPILLADNRVVAFARGDDANATSIGLIVPTQLVPRELWDGTAPASAAIATGARVVVEAATRPKASEYRTVLVDFQNDHCDGTTIKTKAIEARTGWTIEPTTAELSALSSVGANNVVNIEQATPNGLVLTAQLNNIGKCLNVFGAEATGDAKALFAGTLTYLETPGPNASVWETVADARSAKNVLAPLASNSGSELRFSVVTPDGKVRPFKPTTSELKVDGAQRYLDTSKVFSRLGVQ